jgi:hypothetical protein
LLPALPEKIMANIFLIVEGVVSGPMLQEAARFVGADMEHTSIATACPSGSTFDFVVEMFGPSTPASLQLVSSAAAGVSKGGSLVLLEPCTAANEVRCPALIQIPLVWMTGNLNSLMLLRFRASLRSSR